MRDKNLTLRTFSIQLEKTVLRVSQLDRKFPRHQVLDSPILLPTSEEFRVFYPKSFRLLRALSISLWYLPEEIKWRFLLDLQEMKFSWLNSKQKLELSILISSREACEFYLFETKRYSSNEIFGNILGNDLKDLNKELKVSWRIRRKARKLVRRRGYKDHGARRPDDRWLPKNDFSFTEEQNLLDEKSDHYNSFIIRLLSFIENERKEVLLKELSEN